MMLLCFQENYVAWTRLVLNSWFLMPIALRLDVLPLIGILCGSSFGETSPALSVIDVGQQNG
jgi:hypothetical protein